MIFVECIPEHLGILVNDGILTDGDFT